MKEAASLQRSVEDLLDEAARLSFRPPVVVKVSQLFEDSEELPKWKSQRSWPTDPPIFLCINWNGAMNAFGALRGTCLGVPVAQQ